MYTERSIQEAEENYLPAVESFFIEKWGKTQLWSHDLTHHRRVWQYAKELLGATGSCTDILFIKKLLIACCLHDLGIAFDRSEKHGRHSRELCEVFLISTGSDPSEYADLTEAIETHDNKEYPGVPIKNRLHTLLSAADDLDAFGHTGVLRYSEIYLERGYEPVEMIPEILKNAESRFRNFEINFSSCRDLVERHRLRYYLLRDFFLALSHELISET